MTLRESLVRFGYAQTMYGNWFSDQWSRIWFRWWCPYPVIADHRAKACVASGNCGCGNRAALQDKG